MEILEPTGLYETNPAPKQRYPWSKWMSGEVIFLKEGVDFHTDFRSFLPSIYNAARKRNLNIAIRTARYAGAGGEVIFQAYPEGALKPVLPDFTTLIQLQEDPTIPTCPHCGNTLPGGDLAQYGVCIRIVRRSQPNPGYYNRHTNEFLGELP